MVLTYTKILMHLFMKKRLEARKIKRKGKNDSIFSGQEMYEQHPISDLGFMMAQGLCLKYLHI